MSCGEGKEDRLVVEQRTAHESDAVAMARFTDANSYLVRRKKEDEAGPQGRSRLSRTTTKTVPSSIVMTRSSSFGTVLTPRMMTIGVSIVCP